MSEEKRGKLIVIEGTDGTGKATQVKALKLKAIAEEIKIITHSFPKYGTPTGDAIEDYLNGEFGNPVEIPPKIASRLYAADREAVIPYIRKPLELGANILCDRYVGSNLAHQGAKLFTLKEREDFVKWNEKYEFEKLRIPKPDLTICLHVPREETQKAMENQQRKKDGHEANEEYQERVIETYLWLAKTKPDWRLIESMDKERRKTIEKITEEVWEIISPVLVR